MRLKAARLWRLIGGDAQSCRVQLGQVGCRLSADSVAKWCCRVIAMTRRTCEVPGEAHHPCHGDDVTAYPRRHRPLSPRYLSFREIGDTRYYGDSRADTSRWPCPRVRLAGEFKRPASPGNRGAGCRGAIAPSPFCRSMRGRTRSTPGRQFRRGKKIACHERSLLARR